MPSVQKWKSGNMPIVGDNLLYNGQPIVCEFSNDAGFVFVQKEFKSMNPQWYVCSLDFKLSDQFTEIEESETTKAIQRLYDACPNSLVNETIRKQLCTELFNNGFGSLVLAEADTLHWVCSNIVDLPDGIHIQLRSRERKLRSKK